MLVASRELHKFFHDCKDVLGRISEKQHAMSDELGRDAGSVSQLQRKHQNFLQDLQTLQSQVQQIEDESAKLQASYAGDKAKEITNREAEVRSAWAALQAMCDARKQKLADTGDLFKFFNMVRTLMLWMDDVARQMNTSEKPRDVSGVELLMNNHQSLKAEIDTREDNFTACISLGKELLSRNHYASTEIKEKLLGLTNQRNSLLHRWEERWENLQLILEVYQFARDAAVAEVWLIAQEPYLLSQELGMTIDEVENLIKKHEAFEKSASAQEERFMALERLTTFELKELKRRQAEEERKRQEELAAKTPPPTSPQEQPSDRPDGEGVSEAEVQQNGEKEAESRKVPRQSTKDTAGSTLGRKKDRSRSKSPFRSFRWKKSTPKSPTQTSASDDEGNLERAAERPSPAAEESHLEGLLVRKHEWENTTKKASNRSWDKLYSVVRGTKLLFYKDAKSAKASPEVYAKGETPLDLRGGSCEIAADYTKKKHVFRVKAASGAEILLQAKDDEEMRQWVSMLSGLSDAQGSGGPSRSHTLPAPGDRKDEPKRRSFFTLKKN
uniref:PH domain-containing protein n=1 Tax=Graphocephala atropunctata TaxID=36148 RepID=A0A1B6LLG0_9HEMI